MLDLWAILLPILLADIVNPVLFAYMVYAVGSDRPLLNSTSALLGHTVAYLSFGIGLTFAFEAISVRLSNPMPMDYGLGLLVGLLLLWVAWLSRGSEKKKQPESQVTAVTPLKAFGIGAVINIIGLPFALPYFAALDQILKADLTVADSIIVIVGYNLGYALPFLLVPVLAYLMGERSRPVLARINEKVDKVSAYLMPVMLTLVGCVLVLDAVLYFVRGEGLY